jgi:hypothetical protein
MRPTIGRAMAKKAPSQLMRGVRRAAAREARKKLLRASLAGPFAYIPPRQELVRGRPLPPRTKRRIAAMSEAQANTIVDHLIRRKTARG